MSWGGGGAGGCGEFRGLEYVPDEYAAKFCRVKEKYSVQT